MKRLSAQLATLTIALSLAALPLSACGTSANTGTGADEPSPAASQPAEVDPSSWTSMRDALATADLSDISYGYDDNTLVCVFKSGGAYVRTVARMQDEVHERLNGLDVGTADYSEQFAEVVGDLGLVEASDISAELLSQEDVEQYVGRSGQDLVDAGFTFSTYFMYGGDQTGAEMEKGNFSYGFTFDTQVSEEKTEDGGASIMDATVVEAQSNGNLSNAALDPTAAG